LLTFRFFFTEFLRKIKLLPQRSVRNLDLPPHFEIEVLSKGHDKTSFFCDDKEIDGYLYHQASQDIRKNAASCFVLVDKNSNNKIAGYYTISSGRIPLSELAQEDIKNVARYEELPVALVGRLGVDKQYKGQKLGYILLQHAEQKAKESIVKSCGLILDAMHEGLYNYYKDYGFKQYKSSPKKFVLIFPKNKTI
jgi:GNAT superfamily N-acetyltransferase